MTQSLEALARRTSSMQGIRSIVHTMKTLSVINAAPYEHAARAIEAYHAAVTTGLHAFLRRTGPLEADPSAVTTKVLIVFGSDHGLCGNYNEALAGNVARHLADRPERVTVLCIGAQMADALQDQHIMPAKTFLPPASVDGIGRLANLLIRTLDEIRCGQGEGSRHGLGRETDDIAVCLAYFMRDGSAGQKPVVLPLLPLDRDLVSGLQAKPWLSRSLPSFTMPPPALLQALIRGHVFAGLFRAAAEALVTENAARLALMQQAEQSVDDRLEALTAQTRAVRQSEITTEILDVIIGFEALGKRKR